MSLATAAVEIAARVPLLDRVFGGRVSDDRAPGGVEPAVSSRDRALIALPDRVILVMCEIFLVGATLAAFRIMFWWLFLPILAIALFFTWRFLPQRVGISRAHRNGAILAVALALVWAVVQFPLASQYMVAIRDPGIYMIVGAVIAHSGGSPLNVVTAHHLSSLVPGLSAGLGPFGSANGVDVRLQGSNGVPSMIAIGYWLAGVQGAIVVNLVIGAVGLVAVYALARRFMGPYWSLLPSLILGASMPWIYFSRTSYTEVMAALLVIVSAIWIISAFNTLRLSHFIISGALVGASSLTRVDGALEFAGALGGVVLVLIGVGRTSADERLRWKVLAFAAAGWVFLGFGIADLVINNARYLHNLGSSPRQLWEGSAALTVVLVILALSPLGGRAFEFTRLTRRIAIAASVALGALFVFWLSRPWWLIDRHFKPGPYQQAVGGLQAADGLPIDPARGYDEYSLWWFAWYFGWAFLALAIVGMCVWVFWSVSRRNAANIVILATVAVVAVLYLDDIKITPDQIFAFRRVLPVITPVLVLAAVFAIRLLWKSRRRWLRGAAIVALVGCVIGVFIPWGQIMFTVEGGGQAAEIEQICTSVGDAPVVAFVNQGAPANYPSTIAAICDKQVVTVGDAATFDWKRLAAASTGRVAVVTWNFQLVKWVHTPSEPTKLSVIRMWTEHLLMPPRTASLSVRSVYVGRLQSDGLVAFTHR